MKTYTKGDKCPVHGCEMVFEHMTTPYCRQCQNEVSAGFELLLNSPLRPRKTTMTKTLLEQAHEAARRAIERHPAYDCGSTGDAEMAHDAVSAFLSVLLSQGYKILGPEASEGMVEAAYARTDWGPYGYDDAPDGAASADKAWRAMHAAAPSFPEGPATDEEEMVERVARRICRETHEPITQEKHAVMALDLTVNMETYRRLARAAIAAMRLTLSEEDRARVEEIRAWKDGKSDTSKYNFSCAHSYCLDALSLIDKQTEAG